MNPSQNNLQILLTTPGAWHIRHTARAFAGRDALAGLWISEKNEAGIPPQLYRRAWPFHLALKPFLHLGPQIWSERLFYHYLPIWRAWFNSQTWPAGVTVVHAIAGYGTEPFDHAEKISALKVLDCPNSHPMTYYGSWQRECDLWCPGYQLPVTRTIFARMTRELERADLIIVQSNYCRDTMLMNGIPAEKIIINPMGVDTSTFKPRKEVPAKPRFVSIGTICLRKGHQYLFRAFEKVKAVLPDAELVCLGIVKEDFEPEWPRWEKLVTRIHYLHLDQLVELLQNSTAFVFPSVEEGIGRAQIEALASGLPVIGTHEGGATTLIDDGVEGFIVRSRDPQHLAQAMIRAATDRDLNRRMGEAAYRKGAVKNTWQDYGDRLLVEYSRRLKK